MPIFSSTLQCPAPLCDRSAWPFFPCGLFSCQTFFPVSPVHYIVIGHTGNRSDRKRGHQEKMLLAILFIFEMSHLSEKSIAITAELTLGSHRWGVSRVLAIILWLNRFYVWERFAFYYIVIGIIFFSVTKNKSHRTFPSRTPSIFYLQEKNTNYKFVYIK